MNWAVAKPPKQDPKSYVYRLCPFKLLPFSLSALLHISRYPHPTHLPTHDTSTIHSQPHHLLPSLLSLLPSFLHLHGTVLPPSFPLFYSSSATNVLNPTPPTLSVIQSLTHIRPLTHSTHHPRIEQRHLATQVRLTNHVHQPTFSVIKLPYRTNLSFSPSPFFFLSFFG